MESEITSENDHSIHMSRNSKPPVIRKGKLVVVDLAGSERVHKSGVYQVSLILDSYKPKRSYLDMTWPQQKDLKWCWTSFNIFKIMFLEVYYEFKHKKFKTH